MTSEIRANTLKNRVGLGTVSFTNTGPVVSGIITSLGADINGDLDVDGVSTFSDHVSIPDDKELRIGNSSDLKLVHTTSLSSISSGGVNNFTLRQSAGNGFLFIHGDQLHLRSQSTNEPYLIATNNGPVSLYYDQNNHNTAKLVTSATGVTINGTAVATGADINGDLDVDGHTNLDNVSIAGITTFSVGPVAANGQFYRGIINSGAQEKIIGGYSSGSDTLRLGETMYLTSTGLGINVSTPEELLDLGNALQINLKVGGRGYLGQGYSTAATILGHSVKAKTTGTVSGGMEVTETNSGGGAPTAMRMQSGNIEFHTAASGTSGATFDSERLRIDSSGNVLIKGTNHQARWYRDAGDRYGALFYDGGQFTLQNPYNDNFQITTSAGTVLYKFMNSGKMGIGIASPDSMLHIHTDSAGTVTADADANELVLESAGNTGMSILSPGTGESSIYFGNPGTNGQKDGWIKYYHETHSTTANRRALTFKTSGSEKLRIDSAGRCIVGGGTHAGGSALVVKGGNQNSYSTIGMFSNHTNPSDNTLLSQIRFGANASAVGSDIRVYADADWANNDYPTRMSFYTTPDGSNNRTERLQIDKDGRTSISKNGWVGNDMSFALTVHTGSTSDSNNAVNDGIMIVSQNNNGNQNSTTGKIMWCGHAQTNGPFIYGKNAQAYGKKDLVFNTRSTANDYTTQLEETARFTYYGALRVNKIEPRDGLDTNAFGGIIQVKWSANVDNANYSSTSDVTMQTVNITPTSNDARILIHVVYPSIRSYTTGNTRNRLNQHIKRDGTEIYSLPEMPQWRGANFGSSGVEINKNVVFTHIDSPSTTNQVTYTATWQSVDGHIWNTASAQMVMICAELTGY